MCSLSTERAPRAEMRSRHCRCGVAPALPRRVAVGGLFAGPRSADAFGMDIETRRGVELREVTKRHGRGSAAVVALDGVTVGFVPGTFTAIMGPSGSGKSTLLQCAAGLDLPDSGDVRIGATELGGLGERRLAQLRRRR